MKTYVKFGSLMIVIVGSLVWLAVGGVKDTKTYYKTLPELQKMGNAAEGQKIRVAGDVQPGSIQKQAAEVSFVLHQGSTVLHVVYRGSDPLPDTFRDNSMAMADGRLGADGVFMATKIQAKCASKYEAKPMKPSLTHPAGGSANPQQS
jgi:cytochrome c-type biogenesis protein CcmE